MTLDLIMVFQYIKGACKKEGQGIFTTACSARSRGSSLKKLDLDWP